MQINIPVGNYDLLFTSNSEHAVSEKELFHLKIYGALYVFPGNGSTLKHIRETIGLSHKEMDNCFNLAGQYSHSTYANLELMGSNYVDHIEFHSIDSRVGPRPKENFRYSLERFLLAILAMNKIDREFRITDYKFKGEIESVQ